MAFESKLALPALLPLSMLPALLPLSIKCDINHVKESASHPTAPRTLVSNLMPICSDNIRQWLVAVFQHRRIVKFVAENCRSSSSNTAIHLQHRSAVAKMQAALQKRRL